MNCARAGLLAVVAGLCAAAAFAEAPSADFPFGKRVEGRHFVQEGAPAEIGTAVAAWLQTL